MNQWFVSWETFKLTGYFFLLPMLTFLGALPLHAQNQPLFEAFSDARQVLLNNYFEVTFTLKNADGTNFKPPSFNDFYVLSGPARGIRSTIINGQVSREMSYTYTLQGKKPGKFVIGSALITVGNKIMRSRAIEVEVLEGKGDLEGATEFFIRAEPSATEAYIGQQIRLDYKLYRTVEIQNYNITEESDYVGFYAQDVKRPDSRPRREIINGVQYFTQVLKSTALYPQQAGTLTIDPAVIQLGVILPGNRNPGSFFFRNEVRRVPVTTEVVNIEVKELPPDPPASFSGAIGKFRVSTVVNRTTVTTDDALTLIMTIEGDGDVKRIQPPAIDFPKSFELYEPRVVERDRGEMNGFRIGTKVIEYLCLPKEAGTYEVRPEFSYFDPDSSAYITLPGNTYNLTVRQGNALKTPINLTDKEAAGDIHFIDLNTRLRKGDRRLFLGSTGFWVLLLLPLLALGGVITYKAVQKKKAGIDPLELKKRRARKIAMKRLETADVHLKAGESRRFFDEVSKAMLGYVSDKLHLPRSEMTKHNMQERLERLEVEPRNVEQFVAIINNCEMALFAGRDNAEAMQTTYNDALEVLAGIEKQITD